MRTKMPSLLASLFEGKKSKNDQQPKPVVYSNRDVENVVFRRSQRKSHEPNQRTKKMLTKEAEASAAKSSSMKKKKKETR